MIQLRVCVMSHVFASCYCDRIFPLSAALIVRYNLCTILSLQYFYDLCFMHVYLYSAAGKFSFISLNTAMKDSILNESKLTVRGIEVGKLLSINNNIRYDPTPTSDTWQMQRSVMPCITLCIYLIVIINFLSEALVPVILLLFSSMKGKHIKND